jgi:hypothetical protein
MAFSGTRNDDGKKSPEKTFPLSHVLDAASTVKLHLVKLLNKHRIQSYAVNPSRDFRNILIVNTVAMPLIHVGLLQI